MCRLINLKSFFNTKTLAVFALALTIGLTSNLIFGRYIFRYSIIETFTQAEVEAKLNKKIRVDFHSSAKIGTVISYRTEINGEIYVEIRFDSPMAGVRDKLGFNKENYQRMVTEIEESK